MEHTNAEKEPWRDGESGVKYLGRGPEIDWGIVRFKPGDELDGHYHQRVEETFYFPHGAPLFLLNGRAIRVCPGDVFRVEAGECHNIINDTSEEVTAVFIKCPFLPEDKVKA